MKTVRDFPVSVTSKVCSKCNIEKPAEDFHRYRRNTDGLQSYCEACMYEDCLKRIAADPLKHYMKGKRTTLRKYGVPLEQHEAVIKETLFGNCEICGCSREQNRCKDALYIDHCHSSGLYRGVLCENCNFILGRCADEPQILKNAIYYLEKHSSKKSAIPPPPQ